MKNMNLLFNYNYKNSFDMITTSLSTHEMHESS